MKRWAIGLVVMFGLSCGFVSPAVDFNGDGKDDVAIFREGTGLWAVRGITRVYFGTKMDIPLPGDYCAGPAAEMAIFRPSMGLWAIRGVTRIYYGNDGDIALGQSGLKQSSNFFYDPAKHAFRAGKATAGQWNDQSVGMNSIAIGHNTTASDFFSTAMGYFTTASDWSSTAMGYYAKASGQCSTAMGYFTEAKGSYSTAIGDNTTASGSSSTAMGGYITVSGKHSFGYGTSDSSAVDVAADKVFVIHGADVGIGTHNPQSKLHIYNGASGATPLTSTGLVVENSGNIECSLLSGTTGYGSILFGDSGDNDIGYVQYIHNGDCLRFGTNASERVRMDSFGNVGIGDTNPSNILTVVAGSATDPIADAWTTYACDSKHKNIIREINPHDYLEGLRKTRMVEWTRKAPNDEMAKLPKYSKRSVGTLIDGPGAPREIMTFDENGNPAGVDLLAYCGYLHVTLKEAALEIKEQQEKIANLEKAIESLRE